MLSPALRRFNELYAFVNARTTLGQAGVRDPEYPCDAFDAQGYDGLGKCLSDGHYLCTECSHLSPDASRFTEHGSAGRVDRFRLWSRRRGDA